MPAVMPFAAVASYNCVPFTFTTQDQVDFAMSRDWDGSFSCRQIHEYIEVHGTAIGLRGNPYTWKVDAIFDATGGAPKPISKSPDTWLRRPYIPLVTPLELP
jgi:hypothetical protein